MYLTPVMGTPPPRVGHIDPVALEPREVDKRQSVAFPFTPPFNFTGQPAMSVPLAWSESGCRSACSSPRATATRRRSSVSRHSSRRLGRGARRSPRCGARSLTHDSGQAPSADARGGPSPSASDAQRRAQRGAAERSQPDRAAGAGFALGAFTLWGVLPAYWKALANVAPPEILANRVVWSLLFTLAIAAALGRLHELARGAAHAAATCWRCSRAAS